jgi:ABC-type multidrug transport system ATPase subunit
MSEPLLSFQSAWVFYDDFCVFEKVDWNVCRGEVHALMGSNGSGKSTLLKSCLGLVSLSAGKIRLFSHAPDHPNVLAKVSYLPERFDPPAGVRARDLLNTLTRNTLHKNMAHDFLHRLEFRGKKDLDTPMDALSKGNRQKILVALCLSTPSDLFLLDEMTSGLDSPTISALGNIFEELQAHGKTIVFTTHCLEEARTFSGHVWRIHQRKLEKKI